jgi:hypothetical protein
MTLLVSRFKISSHSFLMILAVLLCVARARSSKALCCARWMIKEQGKSALRMIVREKSAALQKGDEIIPSPTLFSACAAPRARYSLGWR